MKLTSSLSLSSAGRTFAGKDLSFSARSNIYENDILGINLP